MALIANAFINITKIPDSRLFKGEKGSYADIVVKFFYDEDEQGNNVFLYLGQTKVEMMEGAEVVEIGRGKVVWDKDEPAGKVIMYASINMDKIPEDRVIVGSKGKYIEVAVTLNDEVGQYKHDSSISLPISKEEKEAGIKRTYLGNGKTTRKLAAAAGAGIPEEHAELPPPAGTEPFDDLPF